MHEFDELIKSFIIKIIVKKTKKYFNDKNIKNSKPKYTKILEFMRKYSIEKPNSIGEISNKEFCSFKTTEENFPNKNNSANVNNNIEKSLPYKKTQKIKLPFKVIDSNDVTMNNNFKRKNLDIENLPMSKLSELKNDNINPNLLNNKTIRNVHFDINICKINMNNFISILSGRNQLISSLDKTLNSIRDDIKMEL